MKSTIVSAIVLGIAVFASGELELVEDLYDYDNSGDVLTILEDGDYFVCSKQCIDSKWQCNPCELDLDSFILCEDGKLSDRCINECCIEVDTVAGSGRQDASSGSDEYEDTYDYDYSYGYDYDDDDEDGEDEEDDEIPSARGEFPEDYEVVYDFDNGETDTLVTLHDGDHIECDKACIHQSFPNECNTCEVERDLGDVFCLHGRLSRSCRQNCCDTLNPPGTDESASDSVNNYRMVNDYHNSLTTLHDGEYYDCDKICIDDHFHNECKTCEVEFDGARAGDVWCERGRVSRACRQECCFKIGGETDSSRPGRVYTASDDYEIVYDLDNNDDEDVLSTVHDDVVFDCSKSCIDDNFEFACNRCEVDPDLGDVWCLNGRVNRSCRQECCIAVDE